MVELLDPKYDCIFKRIFGTEEGKPRLISLLNALLKGQPCIRSLELNNPEITKVLEDDKTSRLDIKATSDDGTLLDIEIQCRNTGELPERAVHYMANLFPHAVKEGEKYTKAKVISIWLLGEKTTSRQNAISNAYMTFQKDDKDPYERMTDSARIIFVELSKFNPKDADMHDLLTGWLSFLKNPAFLDQSFLKNQAISSAFSTLQYVSGDRIVQQIYDARRMTLNDRNSEMTIAREQGLAEGLAEGLAKGHAKGKAEGLEQGLIEGEMLGVIKTARNLLAIDLPLEQISKATGLSIEKLKNL